MFVIKYFYNSVIATGMMPSTSAPLDKAELRVLSRRRGSRGLSNTTNENDFRILYSTAQSTIESSAWTWRLGWVKPSSSAPLDRAELRELFHRRQSRSLQHDQPKNYFRILQSSAQSQSSQACGLGRLGWVRPSSSKRPSRHMRPDQLSPL